jgi:aspartate aminotransferase
MYECAIPLMQRGEDLIHLEVGRPSFDTPAHIKEATKKALDDGLVHYGDFQGNQDFREALSTKLREQNQIDASPDEILVTNGLTHGGYVACLAALDPGDEVILLEPYYPQHINKIELAGGKVVTAKLDGKNGYRVDGDAIRACLNNKTRMIAVVNPTNPTGRVFDRDELQIIADIAIEHDLLVLSDEVYEQIVYDGHQHTSIASLDGMKERTISCFAFTKGYAMDGWRMGYLVVRKDYLDAFLVREMVAEDKRRRDLVVERMNQMPGVSCAVPQGSIYAFPDISGTGMSSSDLAIDILDQTNVVTEAGSFYGTAGEGRLRICFGAESYERIAEAMDRLDAYFAAQVVARAK